MSCLKGERKISFSNPCCVENNQYLDLATKHKIGLFLKNTMMPPLFVFSISFSDSFWFCIQSLPMPCHEWNGVYANWRTSCLQSTLQWSASINNRGFGTTTLTNQSCRSKRRGIPRLKVQLIFVALCVVQTKLKITPSMVNDRFVSK